MLMVSVGQPPGLPVGQNPSPDPVNRFRLARQVILFLLGVVVIIDGIFASNTPVPEIVTGLVLLGLVPIDDLMSRIPRPPRESPPPVEVTHGTD